MSEESKKYPYAGAYFEHDIFVSYAHGVRTEDGSDPNLKKWTNELIEQLKSDIPYSLEVQQDPVNIWSDVKLDRTAPLTDELKKRVGNSAMLLIVMTRNYLDSDWCLKEREWFKSEIERRGVDVENVFVVRAMPTENEHWPDFLKDSQGATVLGYPFCAESEGIKGRPYGWITPDASPTKTEFINALTRLASDMALRLDEIRKAHQFATEAGDSSAEDEDETPQGTRWPVIVAPGTDDVRTHCNEVRKLLRKGGCMVLPDRQMKIEEFTEQDQAQAFEMARAFVQLVGTVPAREGDQKIGKVETFATQAQMESIKRFHWRDSRIPLEAFDHEPGYQNFIGNLGEISSETFPDFTSDILSYLESEHTLADGQESTLKAYMEVPPDGLGEFDRWKSDIKRDSDDFVLLPLKAPSQGKISQIQDERKSRQIVFAMCEIVLLLYCYSGKQDWLGDAIVNFEKDKTLVNRHYKHAPAPIVIDYFDGEGSVLAEGMGVDVIKWKEGSDPASLWEQLRGIVS